MYYIIYKITNLINNKIYIGCHSTENIEDGYLGSGHLLKKAIKKYGKLNFKKEILFNANSKEEMLLLESALVNREFVERKDTYNVKEGGIGWKKGVVTVKDKDNNFFKTYVDDPRYLSGEVVQNTTGTIMVKDKTGKIFRVSKDDPRLFTGEIIAATTGLVVVRTATGQIKQVSVDDPDYKSKKLVPVITGRVVVKDSFGNTSLVSLTDPAYLSGELVPIWKNWKHKEETKRKIGEANKKLTGNRNSQYNTCWITNGKENKKIKLTELNSWLRIGWNRGRIINI